MAGYYFSQCPTTAVLYGRSGYNKDDDEDTDGRQNSGRSGYNKTGSNDDDESGDRRGTRNFGRSGYNKDDEDSEEGK